MSGRGLERRHESRNEFLFFRDLTARGAEGFSTITGREQEIEQLLQILNRFSKSNPLLIGPAGCGKTALVESLAFILSRCGDRLPGRLQGLRITELSLTDLIAGAGVVGELEQRLGRLFRCLEGSNIVLFIDEIHTIFGAGAGGNSKSDVANLIKPWLARSSIRVIGATTDAEYRHVLADPAFERRFTPLFVQPLGSDATQKALRKRAQQIGFRVEERELALIVRMARNCLPGRTFPDSAIDVLEHALSIAELRGAAMLSDEDVFRAGRVVARLEPGIERTLQEMIEAGPAHIAKGAAGVLSLLRGELQRPLILRRSDDEATRLATALGEILGGVIEIDTGRMSRREILGAEAGLVGHGERRPVHGLLEQPFKVLFIRDHEGYKDVNVVDEVTEKGYITDAGGRKIPVTVIVVSETGAAGRKIGFAPWELA